MCSLTGHNFSTLPLIRLPSRYADRKFHLHALTVLSGHSWENSTAYYNDGKPQEVSPYTVWQYTISGRGCLKIQEDALDLLPGSLMAVTVPGPQVYFLPEDSDHWEFVFLVMIGREAVRIARMIEQHIGNVISAEGMPKTISLLYETLSRLFSGAIDDPYTNSSYTYRLCMLLLEETGNPWNASRNNSFETLKIFLKNNLYRDISVEEMAQVSNLSRSHFTRLFSREMGVSPRVYLENLRLKTAMEVLFEDGTSIKEAAVRSGIYDVNYFCRIFKKRYGVSPGKYRKSR